MKQKRIPHHWMESMDTWERLKKGEGAALDELMAACSARLMRIIQRERRQRPGADDLLQDIWLAVWIGRDGLTATSIGECINWLKQIAKNKIISESRKKDPIREAMDARPSTSNPQDKFCEQILLDYFDQRISEDKLIAAIDLYGAESILSDDERRVIHEHFFENKTYEEIAAAQECSFQAVWQRVKKILQKLNKRVTLAKEENNEKGTG